LNGPTALKTISFFLFRIFVCSRIAGLKKGGILRKLRQRPFFPVSIAVIVGILGVLALDSTCSFAESKRPEKGSVDFGADKRPEVKTPPQLKGFKTVFADVAEKVVPTVVSVVPTKIDTVTFTNNPFYQFFGDQFGSPFDDFFGQRRGPGGGPPVEKREFRKQGLGSGVIVSKDGYILTNYHVIGGADEIEVKTSDKRSFEAEIVGVDSLSDVAVIKIKGDVKDLPVAYLGDSDKLRPGDWTLAIGNPFSLTSSVTLGIVSALGRTTQNSGMAYQNFIQTDAAINPGNSGGALVNIEGELVGINTMIYTQSGGYMGIGFAIPINMARRIMEDLIYEGKVSRGWLGVMIQELDPATREALGISSETRGVLIGDVFEGQPADIAGIKRGDVVMSINNKPVESPNELKNIVAGIDPGKKVPIELIRDGKKVTLKARLSVRDLDEKGRPRSEGGDDEDKKSDESGNTTYEKLGITVGSITSDIRNRLNLDKDTKGVVIMDLERTSQAAEEGIRPGDVIIEVNRKPVSSVKEFKKQLKSVKPGDSLLLLVHRGGNTFFKAFKIRK